MSLPKTAYGYTWPETFSDQDMSRLMKSENFLLKPFSTPPGPWVMGMRVVHSGSLGEGTARYHLHRETKMVAEWEDTPAADYLADKYLPKSGQMKVKHVTTYTWVRVSVVQPVKTAQDDYSDLAAELSALIPGAGDIVQNPCVCKPFPKTIWSMIQHLNDRHHPDYHDPTDPESDSWSRERIADWLDTLDADLVLDPERKDEPTEFAKALKKDMQALEKLNVQAHEAAVAIDEASGKFMDAIDSLMMSINGMMMKITPKKILDKKSTHAQACTCKTCIPTK